MLESLGLPPVAVLTPSALLGIAILAIITGRLVPRKTYDDKEHEANEWRSEARLLQQANAELREQNGVLLHDLAHGVTSFMESLQRAGEKNQ